MLLTTHRATVYTQSPETDFVMSGILVGRMAMAYFNATSHESTPIFSRCRSTSADLNSYRQGIMQTVQ
jgi:hypothetical protein